MTSMGTPEINAVASFEVHRTGISAGLHGGNGQKLSQGNGEKVSHPPAGVEVASLASSESLSYFSTSPP